MVKAFQTDSLQVSLLTVLPRPNEAYTIYGHTALRLYDPEQRTDVVFNWGTFDFDAPHFLYRFVKGETDYFLSYTDYKHFLYVYSMGNATMVEQVLNLTAEGKEALMQKLSLNLQPENLVYRYNFLFDNCTTRVRDLIEQSTEDQLVYPEQTGTTTFRQLIHSCTEPYPWMTFGIDLLIGSGADSLINARQELFLPLKLKEALDNTPIVISSKQVLTSVPEQVVKRWFWESPLTIGILIFLVYLVVAGMGWWKHRKFKGFFAPLFFIAGAAGCLVAFVTLFSYHPCTSPNWNLLWLHPFHLIAFVGYFFKKPNRLISGYHWINLVLLAGLLLGWHWIPQALNPADIPYILCLGLASGFWLLTLNYTCRK
ncbi:membrane protein [Bacteroidia bacterium]|nr:membrane protein [Bacteroidia bacterium]GHT49213.1 membrane protein [Bacteroidia bacterium]